jgi:hypothetical protein
MQDKEQQLADKLQKFIKEKKWDEILRMHTDALRMLAGFEHALPSGLIAGDSVYCSQVIGQNAFSINTLRILVKLMEAGFRHPKADPEAGITQADILEQHKAVLKFVCSEQHLSEDDTDEHMASIINFTNNYGYGCDWIYDFVKAELYKHIENLDWTEVWNEYGQWICKMLRQFDFESYMLFYRKMLIDDLPGIWLLDETTYLQNENLTKEEKAIVKDIVDINSNIDTKAERHYKRLESENMEPWYPQQNKSILVAISIVPLWYERYKENDTLREGIELLLNEYTSKKAMGFNSFTLAEASENFVIEGVGNNKRIVPKFNLQSSSLEMVQKDMVVRNVVQGAELGFYEYLFAIHGSSNESMVLLLSWFKTLNPYNVLRCFTNSRAGGIDSIILDDELLKILEPIISIDEAIRVVFKSYYSAIESPEAAKRGLRAMITQSEAVNSLMEACSKFKEIKLLSVVSIAELCAYWDNHVLPDGQPTDKAQTSKILFCFRSLEILNDPGALWQKFLEFGAPKKLRELYPANANGLCSFINLIIHKKPDLIQSANRAQDLASYLLHTKEWSFTDTQRACSKLDVQNTAWVVYQRLFNSSEYFWHGVYSIPSIDAGLTKFMLEKYGRDEYFWAWVRKQPSMEHIAVCSSKFLVSREQQFRGFLCEAKQKLTSEEWSKFTDIHVGGQIPHYMKRLGYTRVLREFGIADSLFSSTFILTVLPIAPLFALTVLSAKFLSATHTAIITCATALIATWCISKVHRTRIENVDRVLNWVDQITSPTISELQK